MAIMYHV